MRLTDRPACASGLRSLRLEGVSLVSFQFGTTAEYQEKFIWLGSVLLGLLILMWIWHTCKKHARLKAEHKALVGELVRMMHLVIADHGRVELFPANRPRNSQDIMFNGRCLSCNTEQMRLEAELKEGMTQWPFQFVEVFFRLREDGDEKFFAFTAEVLESRLDGPKVVLAATVPPEVRREQKRAYFRTSLMSSSLPALALWPLSQDESLKAQTTGHALGKPLFGFRPGKVNQILLEDISLGGARLSFEPSYYKSVGTEYQPGEAFVLLVVLAGKNSTSDHQFWLRCRCVHRQRSVGRFEPAMGLQFNDWCMTEKLTEPIVWQPVSEALEVEPLHEWLTQYMRDRQQEKRMEKMNQ